uniref:Mitochondrial translation release factor 1 n=1 Tax=Leptobrachium leishanense TaxID=445787 RepID=A0A8C5PKQ1_9ANUR
MKSTRDIGLLKSCFGHFYSWIVAPQRIQTRHITKCPGYGSHFPIGHTFLQGLGCPPRRCCYNDSHATWCNEKLQNYLNALRKEHEDLSQRRSLSSVKEDDQRTLGKRHNELSPIIALLKEIQAAEQDARELESMCADKNEKEELLQLAMEEKQMVNQNIEMLRRKLLQILLPNDKYDMSDVVLEVTSGRTTGGDICQQFTQEVFEMYQNYAYYKAWSFEILTYAPCDFGGLHHAAARISGEGIYKLLKYEGGTHRVQRIPEVGLSSRMQRIHTGTMTVIVLPQTTEIDIQINPKDLRIDTFRAKGAGGQHVNTTDSAVRIVHLPSGIVVECQQERSQLLNKDKAMMMLKAKLQQQIVEEELSQRHRARKLQVGSRTQSDRIRTYNFTQDRVTDHRISYEVRNIKEFLKGEEPFDDLIQRLQDFADMETLLEVTENYFSKTDQ